MVIDASQPAPAFELRSGATWVSPWPMYAALREQDPVHHVVPRGRPELPTNRD